MKIWTVLLPVVLLACGDKSEDTATTEEEVVNMTPQEGAWTMTDLEFTTDTCGFGEDTGSGEPEPAAMNLVKNTDGSYKLTLDEDTEFACSLSGANFTCEPKVMTEEDAEAGITVTTTLTLGSVFSSNTAMSGNVGMDMTCSGDNCAMLAQFGMTLPCGMAGTFNATAQ